MFETAELGQKVPKKIFKQRVPVLRESLLMAQVELRQAKIPMVVLFAGVDGAGKGASANLLNEWLDPRYIVTRAFSTPSQEEVERPVFWRYWRALPPKGRLGVFLSAWYSQPLVRRVYGESTPAEFEARLDEIRAFEKTLADDGVLLLKFWMHLGKSAQKRRLKALEKDDLQSWRVTKGDWKNWRMYDAFVDNAERIISYTSTGKAPWVIVEGEDPNHRSLAVTEEILSTIQRGLEEKARRVAAKQARLPAPLEISPTERPPLDEARKGEQEVPPPSRRFSRKLTVLSPLDLTQALPKKAFNAELKRLQGQLNLLHRELRERGTSTVLVFEGWDAAGKGGSIRRLVSALDARSVRVLPVAAPNDEERAHHYLWRFWSKIPRAGEVTVFDRSWYGRVLVERIEGFASEDEWRRAYAEINAFEQQLVDHGTVLVKFWIHISPEEQLARFKLREETSYKRWKLTDEDWRNRDKWEDYELAVHDMVERTSTRAAPWVLVEGNDKRFARIKVLRAVVEAWSKAVGS